MSKYTSFISACVSFAIYLSGSGSGLRELERQTHVWPYCRAPGREVHCRESVERNFLCLADQRVPARDVATGRCLFSWPRHWSYHEADVSRGVWLRERVGKTPNRFAVFQCRPVFVVGSVVCSVH